MTNQEVAQRLLAYAKDLEHRDANLFRVRAYRQAAAAVAAYPQPLDVVLATQGRRGLAAIKGIGAHISYTVEGLLRTGVVRTLRGDDGVVALDHILLSVPAWAPSWCGACARTCTSIRWKNWTQRLTMAGCRLLVSVRNGCAAFRKCWPCVWADCLRGAKR
jgi:hypothetical protein